ncbi:MAG: hypothetical protein NVSMB57_08790 [Actinomycetota bacterium]
MRAYPIAEIEIGEARIAGFAQTIGLAEELNVGSVVAKHREGKLAVTALKHDPTRNGSSFSRFRARIQCVKARMQLTRASTRLKANGVRVDPLRAQRINFGQARAFELVESFTHRSAE